MTTFPALNGEPVTERHVKICRDQGHATHTVDGTETPICPRCGSDKSIYAVSCTICGTDHLNNDPKCIAVGPQFNPWFGVRTANITSPASAVTYNVGREIDGVRAQFTAQCKETMARLKELTATLDEDSPEWDIIKIARDIADKAYAEMHHLNVAINEGQI